MIHLRILDCSPVRLLFDSQCCQHHKDTPQKAKDGCPEPPGHDRIIGNRDDEPVQLTGTDMIQIVRDERAADVVGNRTRVKVVKNKVSPPFKMAEFEILYGEGISREGEIIELGVGQGLIEKSGAWYSYNGDRIGQGRENVRTFLKENPDIARHVEAQIRATLMPEESVAADEAGAKKADVKKADEGAADKQA